MGLNPNSKLAAVRAAMEHGDWDRAIKLAAKFQSLGGHGPAIRRGRDAINHPELYKQLGRDLELIRAQAILALKDRFSKSWESASGTNKGDKNGVL